jgi:hypothetical protein
VPAAFVVSVHASQEYYKSPSRELSPEIVATLKTAVDDLAKVYYCLFILISYSIPVF